MTKERQIHEHGDVQFMGERLIRFSRKVYTTYWLQGLSQGQGAEGTPLENIFPPRKSEITIALIYFNLPHPLRTFRHL